MAIGRLIGLSLSVIAISAGACSRSFESRVWHVSTSQAAKRYPVVAQTSDRFAKILGAIDEPPLEARGPTASLTVRLLALPADPRYIVFRVEAVGDSATATWRTEHDDARQWPVSRAAWRAFRETFETVDAWNAPWTSVLSLDGITYGLEIREGDRHRVLWLNNPDFRDENQGFGLFREALESAMGFTTVEVTPNSCLQLTKRPALPGMCRAGPDPSSHE